MIDKIGKKKIIYIGSLIIVAIFISIAYFSYAFFIRDYEYHGKLNIVAGTLNYEIRSNDLNGNNAISIPKNSSKEIVIDVKSLNDINSLFELYYNADSSVGVGYIIENIESQPTGQINARETKVIRVKITNTSSSAKTVTFGVTGGLVGQTLTLGNLGSSIDIGDVKTAIALLNPTTQDVVMCDNANGALNNCSLYSTIDQALASRNTGTMGLLKDVTRSSTLTIPNTKTITLDLNGKTLSQNDTTAFTISTAGNLTINANGGTIGGTSPSLVAVGSANNVVVNGGTYNGMGAASTSKVTLNDCELKGVNSTAIVNGTTNFGNKAFFARQTTTVLLNNVTYNNSSGTFVHLNNGTKVTIKNSKINCTSNCIYGNFTGTLTIEDSTVVSATGYAIRDFSENNNTQITIRRSTIKALGSSQRYAISLERNATMNISDSDIYSTTKGIAAYYLDTTSNAPSGTINITDTNITAGQHAVYNDTAGTATINIKQQSSPMYLTSSTTTDYEGIITNEGGGTITITGNSSNSCTDTQSDTTSGLCVYGRLPVVNSGAGTLSIDGGTYNGTRWTVDNHADGIINITAGVFTNNTDNTILNYSTGQINITQTNKPIYITSLVKAWKPAIRNFSTGIINITANQANACTATASSTTSGLCVYAVGDGNDNSNSGNCAIQNYSTSSMSVNGGTYVGGHYGIYNYNASGHLDIQNASITAGRAIYANNGTIRVCSSTITASRNDLVLNNANAQLTYSSDVVFSNGNNTPKSVANSGTLTQVSTCPIS